MHLLIVEPNATGHHMALYVRYLVRAARARGWRLSLLTSPYALEHPALKLALSESGGSLNVIAMPRYQVRQGVSVLALFWNQFQCFHAIRSTIAKLSTATLPDFIYVINLDHCDKALSVLGSPFGPIKWAGMLMSPKFHRRESRIGPRSRSDLLYQWMFKRLLSIETLNAVMLIDHFFLDFANKLQIPGYGKLAFVPDVGELVGEETSATARAMLGIAPSAFVLLVYGSLSRRKGIHELLIAVDMPHALENVVVHLAGVQDTYVAALLTTPSAKRMIAQGRLILSNFFHSESSEYRAFKAADAVWLGYVGGAHGSSGVLYQSGSLGLPIVATREGLIGSLTKQHELGPAIDPRNRSMVVEAISLLVRDRALGEHYGRRGKELASRHTAAAFGHAICKAIEVSIA